MSRPILLLEFNELCPSLLTRFMERGLLPNFSKLHSQSTVYVTDAQERQEHLEPWIQWVTVHTGLSFAEHGVLLLGDGPKCRKPRLWDILAQNGRSSWVCGSMNTAYDATMQGFLLPDPWTVGVKAYPEREFAPYMRFVSGQVQEHTNRDAAPKRREMLEFLRWMAGHGLSAGTGLHIAKQLLTERITGKFRWRRAVVLDRLQWDVFSWYFRRNRPDFSTFFLNSTAHFQHLYWRNMDPDAFRIRPGAQEQEEYADAVLYGYQQMDVLVGKAMALAGDTHAVVFSSALGQQPCLTYEDSGGKAFYRPRDFGRFTAWAGLGMAHRVEPVMSEEFRLVFDNQADVEAAEAQLQSVVIDGEPGMRTRRIDMGLNVGCRLFRQVADDAPMSAAGQAPARFADLFYRVEGMKSGMHHAEGCLWIRDPARPEHHSATGHVPLKSVAPTLLAMLGVDPGNWMDGAVLPEVVPAGIRGVRREPRSADAVAS